METVYDVLRALIHASRGMLSEAEQHLAHDVIDKVDPSAVEARRRAETELSDTEKAELERLTAKQAAGEKARQESALNAADRAELEQLRAQQALAQRHGALPVDPPHPAGAALAPDDPNYAPPPAAPNPPAADPFGAGNGG